MEQYFSNLFEDNRCERLLILSLSLTDLDVFKQTKFTDIEIEITENLAVEKKFRVQSLKEYYALSLLD